MRLLHFLQTSTPVGGVERYVAALLRSGAPDLTHAVVTHAPGAGPVAGQWPMAQWPWLPPAPAPPLSAIRRFDAAVAVFHTVPSPAVREGVASAGMRVAAFCHGHEWWCASGSRYYEHAGRTCGIEATPLSCAMRYHALGCGSLRPGATVAGFRRARAGTSALVAADAVLVASHFMRDDVVRHGTPGAKVHVVPLPGTLPSAQAHEPDASLGARAGETLPVVLCASRLTPLKGIAPLLDAFGRMQTGARLTLAGTGNAEPGLRRAAAAHPFAPRIAFAGVLEDAALRAAYAGAAVVAVPSLWPEPFGLVGIEALGAGTPVVTSGTGGQSDWAREELGVLTAPADDPGAFAAALDRALVEPQWRERARSAGRRWAAERHGMRAHVAALTAALAPLADPGGVT